MDSITITEKPVMLPKFKAEKVLRIFFFSWVKRDFMACAVRKYHSLFDIDGDVDHLCIQFGDKVYEVHVDGCDAFVANEVVPGFFTNESLLGYYELDLNDMDEEKLLIAKFALDQDVLMQRKLNWKGCLKYAWDFFTLPERTLVVLNYNLPEATIKRHRNVAGFHLPFTCATQAANLLFTLFSLQPIIDNHLPTTIAYVTIAMSESGLGKSYAAIDD